MAAAPAAEESEGPTSASGVLTLGVVDAGAGSGVRFPRSAASPAGGRVDVVGRVARFPRREAPDTRWAGGAADAVDLEFRGAWIRLLAVAIDFLVLVAVQAVIALATGFNVPLWAPFIISLVYFVGFWSWRAQTPGKMVIRASVVNGDGNPLGFPRALLRYLAWLIPFYPPLVMTLFVGVLPRVITLAVLFVAAFVVVALDGRKRGIHDMLAGTYVVANT